MTPKVRLLALLAVLTASSGFSPLRNGGFPWPNFFASKEKGGNDEKQKTPFFLDTYDKATDEFQEAKELLAKAKADMEKEPVKAAEEPEQKRDVFVRPTISIRNARPTLSVELTDEMKEELAHAASTVGKALVDEVVSPLLSPDIEKGVSKDTIRGAILTGAAVSVLAGGGLMGIGAAGLGAAYIAISPGKPGQALRAVGGAAWESAQAAGELYEKYGGGQKFASATKKMLTACVEIIQQQIERSTNATAIAEAEEAARAGAEKKAQEEFERERQEAIKLKEEAKARDIAEKRRKKEEMLRLEEEARLVEEEARQLEEEEARLAEEAQKAEEVRIAEEVRAAEEARLAEEARTAKLAEELLLEAEKRLAEEAEETRLAEEAQKAEEARIAEEVRAAEEARLAEEARTAKLADELLLEAEKRLAEEAQEARLAEEAQKAEEARRAEETRAAEEARLAEEARTARLADELHLEAEKRLAEEAQKREEARLAEETRLAEDIIMEDSDFEAAVRLAQSLDGKIAGLEDAIAGKEEKAEWEAAGRLAQELGKGESVDEDDEQEMEALARAAREAVDKFEAEMVAKGMDDEFDEDEDEFDEFEEDFEDDFDEEEEDESEEEYDEKEGDDFLDAMADEGVDLEELGRAARAAVEEFELGNIEENEIQDVGKAARAAVEMFESEPVDAATAGSVQTDWSKLTVAQLRDELRTRGLKSTGKKTDLVATLEANDMEIVGSPATREETIWADAELDEPSLDEIKRMPVQDKPDLDDPAAPAAVEASGIAEETASDYESMSVKELQDELRTRGLKVSGKKAELVERLRSSE